MLSVLIVDDDPEILELNTSIFESKNFKVFQASNGLEGFNLYKVYKPDLVVTDLLMPKMNGLELLCAIRDLGDTVPILVVTGNENEAAGVVEKLADGVFLKPYTNQELYYAAKLLLKNKDLDKAI